MNALNTLGITVWLRYVQLSSRESCFSVLIHSLTVLSVRYAFEMNLGAEFNAWAGNPTGKPFSMGSNIPMVFEIELVLLSFHRELERHVHCHQSWYY